MMKFDIVAEKLILAACITPANQIYIATFYCVGEGKDSQRMGEGYINRRKAPRIFLRTTTAGSPFPFLYEQQVVLFTATSRYR